MQGTTTYSTGKCVRINAITTPLLKFKSSRMRSNRNKKCKKDSLTKQPVETLIELQLKGSKIFSLTRASAL